MSFNPTCAESGHRRCRRRTPRDRNSLLRRNGDEPGEDRLALSGERGGLWLALVMDWSWIFSGAQSESFGGGPAALAPGHGAAGFEIDRVDAAAGTPEHTVALASADGFTDSYQAAIAS